MKIFWTLLLWTLFVQLSGQYAGICYNVVDGDTYDVVVDLGFDISVDIRVRLKDYDTPETWRPECDAERSHGIKAKAFAEMMLKNTTIMLDCSGATHCGRYVCDVWTEQNEFLGELLKEKGLLKRDDYCKP